MVNRSKKIDYIFILTLFFIYLFNMCNGLNTRDSGEFLVSAATLDITHSPGNPLYNIFGKIFYYIGGIQGIIFLSVFFSLLSFFLLLQFFESITGKLIITLFFSLYNVFYYSTTAEIYTLNLFIFVCIFLLFLRDHYKTMFLFCGFAVLNSPANILFVLPFMIYAFYKEKKYLEHIFLFILPVTIFLYIPIRSSQGVYSGKNYINSIRELFYYILGLDFQVRKNVLNISFLKVLSNLKNVILLYIHNIPLLSVLVIFIYSLFNKKSRELKNYFLLIVFFIYLIFFVVLNLDIRNAIHFLIPGICALFIFCSYNIKNNNLLNILLFFMILYSFSANIPNHNNIPEKYVKDVINSVKEPAIVFSSIDNRIFYFDYYTYFKDFEKNITFINVLDLKDSTYLEKFKNIIKIPEIKDNNIQFNMNAIIELNKENINIYTDIQPHKLGINYVFFRQGLLYQIDEKSKNNTEILKKIDFNSLFIKETDKDPELNNLIISYEKMLYELEREIQRTNKKGIIKRWKSFYSY